MRRLSEDPRGFRAWLQSRTTSIVGTSHDGRRCPFANYLHTELGWESAGSLYVTAGQTGLHDCTRGMCDRYAHVEHPAWVQSFIGVIDARPAARGVRGRDALDALDLVVFTSRLQRASA